MVRNIRIGAVMVVIIWYLKFTNIRISKKVYEPKTSFIIF
jgi:hypothetical protein